MAIDSRDVLVDEGVGEPGQRVLAGTNRHLGGAVAHGRRRGAASSSSLLHQPVTPTRTFWNRAGTVGWPV